MESSRRSRPATALYDLTGMVEKPAPEKAPSDFAIMGRYVLTPEIFDLCRGSKPGAGGEIQLTDALLELAKRRKIYGYEFEGIRYDLGDRVGFITAQIGFGLKRPEVADRLRAYLETVASRKISLGGAVAQLGEHNVRNVGVEGSNPFCSTNFLL